NFQSYFLGATDIGLVPYVITALFGIMPFATMYVYLGSVGRTIAIEEGFGASSIALLCSAYSRRQPSFTRRAKDKAEVAANDRCARLMEAPRMAAQRGFGYSNS